jgi:hypothetical protein
MLINAELGRKKDVSVRSRSLARGDCGRTAEEQRRGCARSAGCYGEDLGQGKRSCSHGVNKS